MVQSASLFGNKLMKRPIPPADCNGSERDALRRRVKQFYRRFNEEDWKGCYALIDPQLTKQGKVELAQYAECMSAFKSAYGSIKLWLTRLSLHPDASSHQRDKRPFAYVYVIWQDDGHAFHMFRERWIKDADRWFTRVVGLVANRQETSPARE